MSRPVEVGLVGLIVGGHSGVPRYAAALTRALDAIAPELPDVRLTLLTTTEGAAAVDARNLAVRDYRLRGRHVNAGPGRILAEHLISASARTAILHFFDVSGPVLAPHRPFVATFHDAAVLRGGLRPRKDAYKRRLWPWAARRARRLVAVSEFAKDEAIRYLGCPPERVVVVRSGPGLAEPSAAEAVPAPAAGRPYVLYVGNLAASKNLPFLVRAFDRADVPVDLVLVGRPGHGFEALRRAAEATASPERVRFVLDASDAELDGLYAGAVGLALPSLYEGFGFTPLEAMARGCPVLASDIPAVREVSGAGALLLPVDDEAAWASAIRRLVHDGALAAELRERGRATVAHYSWERTARRLAHVLHAAGSPARP